MTGCILIDLVELECHFDMWTLMKLRRTWQCSIYQFVLPWSILIKWSVWNYNEQITLLWSDNNSVCVKMSMANICNKLYRSWKTEQSPKVKEDSWWICWNSHTPSQLVVQQFQQNFIKCASWCPQRLPKQPTDLKWYTPISFLFY